MPPLRQILILLPAAAATLTGCTMVGSASPRPDGSPSPPAAPPAERARHFDGTVALAGQELAVSLELRETDPAAHQAILLIREIGLEARGEGTLTAETLRLGLSYGDGDCPGKVYVEARMDPSGLEANGALTATDCTGGESGTIRLARRLVTPEDGQARLR
jgi:hypothetical protein